jgi:hypothetical protein
MSNEVATTTEEDPFFKSLSTLKDLLFSDDTSVTTLFGASSTTAAAPAGTATVDVAAMQEQPTIRIAQLEKLLVDSTQAVENEKKLRSSLNLAFVQLTDHNKQVTEQLEAAEAAKVPLQAEIESLKKALQGKDELLQAKQQEWDAEKQTLIDAKEAALKEGDAWQARLASEQRHVLEYKEKCAAIEQQAKSDRQEQQNQLTKLQEDVTRLREETAGAKQASSQMLALLNELNQLLVIDRIQQLGDGQGNSDQSVVSPDESAVKNDFIASIGQLVNVFVVCLDPTTGSVSQEDINKAKTKVQECRRRVVAVAASASIKKRALSTDLQAPEESTDEGEPAAKRLSVDI